MKPLAPKTRAIYQKVLIRAYGVALPPFQLRPFKDWPHSMRLLLRSAAIHAYRENGYSEEQVTKVARSIQLDYKPTLVPKVPSEKGSLRYEETARALKQPGHAAMALLPLALGLRADEVVSLTRAAVVDAQTDGVLRVMRKGGEEQLLPAGKYKELFAAMLSAPAAHPKNHLQENVIRLTGKKWMTAGEIISTAPTAHGRYVAYWRFIKRVAKEADISARPHVLRHLFATRLILDGAPLPVVQTALNHKNLATTARYLHMSPTAVEKYLRNV